MSSLNTAIGLTSTPRASVTALPLAAGTANHGTDVQGAVATPDGNAGTVPGNDTGVYTPAAIGAPEPLQREDGAGFHFHDMMHRKADGLRPMPRAHYGDYQPLSHTCHETTAQLLQGLQQSASPHETALQVFHALPSALRLPLAQTYDGTRQFIKDHPFFHEGLMNLPIGFGKHFRNVPFIGPARIAFGLVTLNGNEIAKGAETTRGTWAAE